jgi:hypothetical protein
LVVLDTDEDRRGRRGLLPVGGGVDGVPVADPHDPVAFPRIALDHAAVRDDGAAVGGVDGGVAVAGEINGEWPGHRPRDGVVGGAGGADGEEAREENDVALAEVEEGGCLFPGGEGLRRGQAFGPGLARVGGAFEDDGAVVEQHGGNVAQADARLAVDENLTRGIGIEVEVSGVGFGEQGEQSEGDHRTSMVGSKFGF